MNKDEFQRSIHELLGGSSEKTVASWIEFAEECVEANQYAYLAEQPKDKAVEIWLDYQYAELYFVKKDFGADIARKILDMANIPEHAHCLYPFEMRQAAKYFRKNYTAEQMVKLSADDGCLDDISNPRTMKDVQRDISKKKNRDTQSR